MGPHPINSSMDVVGAEKRAVMVRSYHRSEHSATAGHQHSSKEMRVDDIYDERRSGGVMADQPAPLDRY